MGKKKDKDLEKQKKNRKKIEHNIEEVYEDVVKTTKRRVAQQVGKDTPEYEQAKAGVKKLRDQALSQLEQTNLNRSKGKNIKDECILTIDAGTQSIRACLIDLQGNLYDMIKTPIEPYFSNNPGWAEQHPEYYWDVLSATVKRCLKKTEISKNSIKGVTVTTQRGTVINLDKEGNPLRPAILWLDDRKSQLEKYPNSAMKATFKTVGALQTVENAIKNCEANWIRQNQPQIWEKTDKFLFLSGYFHYKLTGEFVDSSANMVGYVPMDYKNFSISKSNDMKWKMFNIDPELLPKIVQPGEIIGTISKKCAEETDIPEGLPVVAAGADKACEVLGSGCMSPEIACLSYGTTATIETTSKNYNEVVPFMPSYNSAIPGYYNTEVMVYRGFWMISWFKQQFGYEEALQAKELHTFTEAIFDEKIKEIPAGCLGLTLQPYWTAPPEMPNARGAIVGFGDVHNKAHMYKALLEGLAYAMKDGANQTEKKNKIKIEKLRISGGGSQSPNAMQITADIFNLPTEKPSTNETSALGAAIDAAVGLQLYPDFETAIENMCSVGEVYEPIPENVEIYKELYSKVYSKLYGKLQPLYKSMRDITSYPES